MSNRFRITVTCPPLQQQEIGEVLQRRFRVTKMAEDLDGQTPEVELKNEIVDMASPGALTRSFEATQDDVCLIELFNIDDAHNQSTSSLSATHTVLDTTPPNAPAGVFAINQEELPDEAIPAEILPETEENPG